MAAQFNRITATREAQFPDVVAMLTGAREDRWLLCLPPGALAQALVDQPPSSASEADIRC